MRSALGLAGAFVFVWAICCGAAGGALALTPERQYEMVSPTFKGGYGAKQIEAVAPDGESVAFVSEGSFEGAPFGFQLQNNYLARRGSSGWSTAPLRVPATLVAAARGSDVSPSLDRVFTIAQPGGASELLANRFEFLTHSTDLPDEAAAWEVAGSWEPVHKTSLAAKYRYSTADGCHMLFSSSSTGTDAFLPEAIGSGQEQLYEYDRGCHGEPASLKFVGTDNRGALIDNACNTDFGDISYTSDGSAFNAMSVDGSEVFFTPCLSGTASEPADPHQVFVRLDGTRTLEVSRPLDPQQPFDGCLAAGVPGEVPCEGALGRPSADFVGASEDGSTVFFTTAASLAGTDVDTGEDLYRATIGCLPSKPGCSPAEREVTSLVQISRDPHGSAANVQGVLRVAPDGRRLYYVAGGDLLSSSQQAELEAEGRPVPHAGAANLYVYDSTSASTGFVADLCTGQELSGSVADSRCPSASETDSSLLEPNAPESQTAGADARFLVFATVAQLSDDDTNATKDIYRYDAENGQLLRVSIGEDGFAANGNAGVGSGGGARILPGHRGSREGGGNREQYEMNSRAVSEDGTRIVFTSVAPLSRAASNGLSNAYEWQAGVDGGQAHVSLVSTGTADEPVENVVISPNGRSIFFVTTQGLVRQDADGAPDVYDARLEGGFPEPPEQIRPCQSDACQGPLTNPAPLLVPGSIAQTPGENLPAPVVVKKKIKAKVKVKKKRKKRPSKKHRKTSQGKGMK